MKYPNLFSSLQLKNLALKNRVVFLPHVTMFGSENRTPSTRHKFYYAERAQGGVGLVITECLYVLPNSGFANMVDASNREGMLSWRETIDAVHAHDTKIFAQLTHHGPETFSAFTRQAIWAPSAIPDPAIREIPKAIDCADIQTLITAFHDAARHVRDAGFDGIELKVGHDGILRAFLSPYFNRRDDEYGGALENRMRLPLEVMRAVRQAVGDDFVMGVRLSLDEGMRSGYTLDDAKIFAKHFESAGADYFSADMGNWLSSELISAPMSTPQGYMLGAIRELRNTVRVPMIAAGRLKHPAHAEQILQDGDADLIGMARQLIADAEWANKARENRVKEIRPCVACNQLCVGNLARNLPIGCVHNPAAGYEETLGANTLQNTARAKLVVVVGGGPAGLKAAEVAARRGHRVTLLEKETVLGGQVALAARAPHHAEWGEIVSHLVTQLERLNVKVELNTNANAEKILAQNPDAVILATGALPNPPPFAVNGNVRVWNEWELFNDANALCDENVLLLDLGVRFEGAAVAETLAENNRVTWVTPALQNGGEIDPSTFPLMRRRVAEKKVTLISENMVVQANDDATLLVNVITGQWTRLNPVNAIVIAGNKRANDELVTQLRARVSELHIIGDCVAPRNVAMAIYEGEMAGRAIK